MAIQKAYRSTPNCQNLPVASHFTHPQKIFQFRTTLTLVAENRTTSFNFPPSKNVDISILFAHSLYIQKTLIYQRFFNIDGILLVSIKNKFALPMIPI